VTAIAGVEYDGGVVIGGDSASTDSRFGRMQAIAPKVWESGEWVFGGCGSWRMMQLVQYNLDLPNIPDGEDDMDKFLASTFTDALRSVLVDSGVVYSKNAVEDLLGDFLIGIRGSLYLLQEDFSFVRSAGGYWATGCGYDLALGALYATEALDPHDRVEIALEAAAEHNGAVMAPFTIIDKPNG
jgi:hypothetical protein